MSLIVLFGVVLAPLGIAYGVACVRDPLRYALPPYAVLIPFSTLISFAPGAFGSLSSLLGLLLGVTLITQLVTTRRSSAVIPAVVPVWLLFLALSGLSLFWSINAQATLSEFSVLASQVILFVALVLTRFDEATLRRFATSLLAGGVLVAVYFFAQLAVYGGPPGGRLTGASAARFGDDLLGANNQAAALLLPLAIAGTRALSGTNAVRLRNAVASGMLLLAVVMTGSRGGLLSAAVVVALVVMMAPSQRLLKAALAVGAVLVLVVVLVFQPGGIGTRQVDRVSNSSGRTDIWAVGLHACPLYCLPGAGWGTFATVYQNELASVPDARIMERGVAFQPHNIYLLAVIQAGVAGLLLVLLGLGLGLSSAVRLPSSLRAPPVAALIGTMVSSFFLSNLEFKFFWAVLAYAAVCETVAAAAPRERDGEPGPEAAPLVAAGWRNR